MKYERVILSARSYIFLFFIFTNMNLYGFFLDDGSDNIHMIAENNNDCRFFIKQRLCIRKSEDRSVDNDCGSGRDRNVYIEEFLKIHDLLPKKIRNIFCSLSEITIVRNDSDFSWTARAGIDMDGNTILAMNAEVFEQRPSLSDWSSWKQQLNFGVSKGAINIQDDLPKVLVYAPMFDDVDFFILFIVIHEFGHLLDTANSVNQWDCINENHKRECLPMVNTWASFSWISELIEFAQENSNGNNDVVGYPRFPVKHERNVVENDDFAGRSDLCFYNCDHFLRKEDASEIYQGFHKSSFISLYGATNSYDDFAESLVFYVLKEYFGLEYKIIMPDGISYDVMEKIDSPTWYDKKFYLENFLSGHLKYP